MAKYALIRNLIVENVTLWDGVTPWTPPQGTQALPCPDHVALGWAYNGETWTAPAPPVVDLAAHRAAGLQALNAAVDAARRRYVPAVHLQEWIYDLKAQEAQAYVANGRPEDASAYPLLSGAAATSGVTASAEADRILASAAALLSLAGRSDELRRLGAAAIGAAQTAGEIDAAVASYTGQIDAL